MSPILLLLNLNISRNEKKASFIAEKEKYIILADAVPPIVINAAGRLVNIILYESFRIIDIIIIPMPHIKPITVVNILSS
jgi:hypothetical protein